jgi:hypothetical protein
MSEVHQELEAREYFATCGGTPDHDRRPDQGPGANKRWAGAHVVANLIR